MKLETLEQLFLHEIGDLLDAENQLIEALPKMAEAASSVKLRDAFQQHLKQTQAQAQRLERIVQQLPKGPRIKTCVAMKGLIKEGEEIIKADGDPAVKDAALIAAAQRVEHYEIAGYGCARTFADLLGMSDVVQTLQRSLDEEGETDRKLTKLAMTVVNLEAASQSV